MFGVKKSHSCLLNLRGVNSFPTKTRFDTEEKANSEMAYFSYKFTKVTSEMIFNICIKETEALIGFLNQKRLINKRVTACLRKERLSKEN